MEDWEKEWAELWNCSHTPAVFLFSFFFSDALSLSSQPSTSVGTLASILWKPAVLFFQGSRGATQDSWTRSKPGVTHWWCSLLALRSSEPPAPSPRPIVITKDLLSLHNALDSKSKKKTPISPNVGSRHWLRKKWLRIPTPLGKVNKGRQTASWSSKSGRWTSFMES